MAAAMAFLSSLAISFPILLTWVVGILLTLTRWNRLTRRTAQLALAGFAISLIAGLGSVLTTTIPSMLIENGVSASQIGMVLAGAGLVMSIVHTIGAICLVMAVFSGRSESITPVSAIHQV